MLTMKIRQLSICFLIGVIYLYMFKCDTIVMPPLYDKKVVRSAKKEEPEFDKRVPNRVRAVKGDIASLQCAVKNVFNETVSWIRHGDLQILTVDNYVFTGDDQVRVTRDDTNCWTLTIKPVRIRDAGMYECQISTQPIKSFAVNLVVDRSGDGDETRISSQTYLVNDQITNSYKSTPIYNEGTGIDTKILEGDEIRLRVGDKLKITCESKNVENSNESAFQRVSTGLRLMWYHNDKIISQNSSHDGTVVRTRILDGGVKSRLVISSTFSNDSGVYTCLPYKRSRAVIAVRISSRGCTVQFVRTINIFLSAILSLSLSMCRFDGLAKE